MFEINLMMLKTQCWELYIFYAAIVFIVGCCMGSFLNVCIWRMPLHESVITAPSHCTKCRHKIRWYENIPLISYTFLRGKCSCCHQRISPRYIIVEAVTGIFFLLAYFALTLSESDLSFMIISGALIMLSIAAAYIDFEHRIIPNQLTYPAIFIGLIFYGAGYLTGKLELNMLLYILFSTGLSAVIFIGFSYFGKIIFRQEALGLGDVKFMIVVSALSGIGNTLLIMLTASLLGIISGIIIAQFSRKSLKNLTIPFGPFLGAATILMLFFDPFRIKFIVYAIFSQF